MEKRYELFTVLIARISRSIRRIKTAEMETMDLKSTHVTCLYYLYKGQAMTAKALCDVCCEDKGAVSRSIAELEQHGYIVCESEQKKRYNSALRLTESGKEVARSIAGKIENAIAKAGEGLSEEKREILYESLALIEENLENICKNYNKG